MALTEIQIPTKLNFYSYIQSAATELDNLVDKFQNLYNFLVKIGVPNYIDIRANLVELKLMLNEFIQFYNEGATAVEKVTKNPAAVIEKFRRMM